MDPGGHDWHALDELARLYAPALAWLNANLLAGDPVMQLIAIVGAFLVARLLSRRLQPHLAHLHERVAPVGRRAVRHLVPLSLPILWLLLQWFSLVALRRAELPAPAVQAAVALLAAWVGVRLASSLIASTFWSRAIAAIVVVGAALKFLGLWTPTLHVLDEMAVTVGAVRLSVRGVIEATLILTVLWWAATAAARLLDRWAERLPDVSPSGRVLLGKTFRFAALSLAVVAALHAIGVDLTTLAVFSGAVGLGIGFGLQKVFSNLVSGMILLLDRSVKPGDVIAVGGHYGWIDALGARYVSVVTRDGIEHLIPNEDLISNRVENWSHSNNLLRVHVPFGIAYDSDLPRAVALAEQAAGDVRRVLPEPRPRCLVLAFADSSINLELRFWISDPRNGLRNVQSDVLMRLWQVFAQHGVTLPYPQRDLHLRTVPTLPVRVVATTDPPIR